MDGLIEFPVERVKAALTEQVVRHFDVVGYTVVDNVFGSPYCTKLRREIQHLYDRGMLYSNKTYYDGKKENDTFSYSNAVSKPNIYELDLIQPSTRSLVGHLDQLYKDRTIMDTLNQFLSKLHLDNLDVKVQYNKGSGGAFPMHFDTTPSVSRRQITCILYLNPTWTSSSGGELRVFPFPYKHIDIAPIEDRLVIFSSHVTLHSVLPSWVPRYCVTLWFEGSINETATSIPHQLSISTTNNTTNTQSLTPSVTSTTCSTVHYPAQFPWLHKVEEIGFILDFSVRKSISKVVYNEEWEESIVNSFDEKDVDAIIHTHRADVEAIKKRYGEDMVALLSSCLPLEHDRNFLEHAF